MLHKHEIKGFLTRYLVALAIGAAQAATFADFRLVSAFIKTRLFNDQLQLNAETVKIFCDAGIDVPFTSLMV